MCAGQTDRHCEQKVIQKIKIIISNHWAVLLYLIILNIIKTTIIITKVAI